MEDEAASHERKIEELRKELYHLKEKRDGSNLEARKWAEKRDRIHRDLKELRSEIVSFRERSRAISERIGVLKASITEAKEERRRRSVQLRDLNEKLRDFRANGSYMKSEDLKAKIDEIEWKIQTTPFSLEEEKPLIQQVRYLEAQLVLHRQVEKLREENEKLRDMIDSARNEISELYEQRRKLREPILGLSKKEDELKTNADRMHRKYLEYKDEAKKIHLEYVGILKQVRILQQELDKIEEKMRTERVRELKDDLEKKALEKLRGQKRLTLDELKVLAEKGEV